MWVAIPIGLESTASSDVNVIAEDNEDWTKEDVGRCDHEKIHQRCE